MNRILGQGAPKLNTSVSPRSPSTDSTRSPMSTGVQQMRSPSAEPFKRANSPAHIINQVLSPSVSRKPVEGKEIEAGPDNVENKYKFDETPDASRPTSTLEQDMEPSAKLEEYNWAELEDQFAKRMEAFRMEEDAIWEEWKSWGEIFKAWASTISVHDEERASKRLRTRIAFTQGSEDSLEAKRQHYMKVVSAFENALMLLGGRQSQHNFI